MARGPQAVLSCFVEEMGLKNHVLQLVNTSEIEEMTRAQWERKMEIIMKIL